MNEHKLPEPDDFGFRDEYGVWNVQEAYGAYQMRAYAEQYAAQAVAAEREACSKLCDDIDALQKRLAECEEKK